mgnify:CR=1 FL=1
MTIIIQVIMNILIIDNRKSQSRKIKEKLEEVFGNYRVITRTSALDALAEAKKALPELVIISDTLTEARAAEIYSLIVNAVGPLPAIFLNNAGRRAKKSPDIAENGLVTQLIAPSVNSIILAAKDSLRMRKLTREIENLRNQLKRAGFDKKIADLTLDSSHRINDTLMTILGNSQLLLCDSKGLNAGIQMKLRKIERAAKEIQSITLSLANTIGTEIRQIETEKTTP